jgi:hypothetical protein
MLFIVICYTVALNLFLFLFFQIRFTPVPIGVAGRPRSSSGIIGVDIIGVSVM